MHATLRQSRKAHDKDTRKQPSYDARTRTDRQATHQTITYEFGKHTSKNISTHINGQVSHPSDNHVSHVTNTRVNNQIMAHARDWKHLHSHEQITNTANNHASHLASTRINNQVTLATKKQSELILKKYSRLRFVCITGEIDSEQIFPVTVCFWTHGYYVFLYNIYLYIYIYNAFYSIYLYL